MQVRPMSSRRNIHFCAGVSVSGVETPVALKRFGDL
jgi:hypothetical protein